MSLNKYIEHTLLRPDAVRSNYTKLFDEAKEHNFWGICIFPDYVKFAKEYLHDTDIKIVTVVGFPFGANKSEVKAYEAKLAIEDGADEIDMVINISALKDRNFDFVKEDIKKVKQASGDKILKVILETDLLECEEIKKACQLCIEAKADFVKTSTGFAKSGVGAKAEDVKLMYETVSPHGLGVKASGGIRDKDSALKMIDAGATRIGTSAGIAICC